MRRRGCGGCGLILLVLLLLALLWAAIVPFRLLQRVGIQESPAERLLGGSPDREAAAALESQMRRAGLNMQGVDVYVLPLGDTGETVAFTVLDASQGFSFDDLWEGDAATDWLEAMADSSSGLEVDRVALTYVGEDGGTLLTVTHEVDAIQAVADGRMSEEEFLDGLGIDFDVWKILGEAAP